MTVKVKPNKYSGGYKIIYKNSQDFEAIKKVFMQSAVFIKIKDQTEPVRVNWQALPYDKAIIGGRHSFYDLGNFNEQSIFFEMTFPDAEAVTIPTDASGTLFKTIQTHSARDTKKLLSEQYDCLIKRLQALETQKPKITTEPTITQRLILRCRSLGTLGTQLFTSRSHGTIPLPASDNESYYTEFGSHISRPK